MNKSINNNQIPIAMKKSAIIIMLAFSFLATQAQDYFINFTGTGDTNALTTIKVDNLSTGATVILNGGDVLHLTSGISVPKSYVNTGTMKMVPNPMTDHSMLTFVAPEKGVAEIRVLNLSGTMVCQKRESLSSGEHSFTISGISKGIYFVKVTGNNYFYSTELISQSDIPGMAKIELNNTVQIPESNQLRNEISMVDMLYKDGEQLLFKSISGKYRTIVTDVPTSSKTMTFHFTACTDADHNNYSVVKLGDQLWMAENLNVGVRIDGNRNQTDNNIIEKYCYNNDESNCTVYGGLYNCNEMMQYTKTEGTQGICPRGWHIPTDEEWTVLTNYLGDDGFAGAKLKETGISHWLKSKSIATNETGFSALPAGYHLWVDSSYDNYFDQGTHGYWWSSTESRFSNFIGRFTHYYSGGIWVVDHSIYDDGLSIRCIKN